MTNGSGALCGLCAGCGISRSISVAGTSYHCSQFLNNWSELSVEAALTHSALVPCVESPSFCAPVPFISHRRGCPMVFHAALNRFL